MRSRSLVVALVVVLGLFAVPSVSAAATRSMHACGPGTVNINAAVNGLQANGVVRKFAAHFGVFPIDGVNTSSRMKHLLAIGRVVKAVPVTDTGCFGDGQTGQTRHGRVLRNGSFVGDVPPAVLGSAVCQNPWKKGCVPGPVIPERVALPISCWNLPGAATQQDIEVQFYIHSKSHTMHPGPGTTVTVGPTTTTSTTSTSNNNPTTTTNGPSNQQQGSCNVMVLGNNNNVNNCITTITIECNGVSVTISTNDGNVDGTLDQQLLANVCGAGLTPTGSTPVGILSVTPLTTLSTGQVVPNYCVGYNLLPSDSGTLSIGFSAGTADHGNPALFGVSGGTGQQCVSYTAPATPGTVTNTVELKNASGTLDETFVQKFTVS